MTPSSNLYRWIVGNNPSPIIITKDGIYKYKIEYLVNYYYLYSKLYYLIK